MARLASSEDATGPPDLKIELQKSPNIEELYTFAVQGCEGRASWTSPILSYLEDGKLPPNSNEAKKVKKQATRFTILNDVLYKRFSLTYLRCIEQDEAKYILEEVHEGICRDHMGVRSLMGKIIRASYFRLTMQKEAKECVKRCDKCQRYGKI